MYIIPQSTLDQVTLPPPMGLSIRNAGLHNFGEWLRREGKGWEFVEDETICRWATEYWNRALNAHAGEKPRRFDRMATDTDRPWLKKKANP